MKQLRLLLAVLFAFSTAHSQAINVSEGTDFPGSAGSAQNFTLDVGENSFSGFISPISDVADHFRVTVPAGHRITSARKTWSNNSAAGNVTFNGEALGQVPANANFTADYPLNAGSYAASATYSIGIGASNWSIIIRVEPNIIIGTEQFDYPDGSIAGRNGGQFWTYKNFLPTGYTGTASFWENVTAVPVIASGRLVTQNSSARRAYTGVPESDGAVNDPASVPSSVAKSVYYRVTATTGAAVPDSFGLSSYDFGSERLFFGKRSGQAKFGIDEIGVSGSNSSTTPDILPNTTYTLVARVDYTADTVRIYVNPNLNADESCQVPAVTRTYTGTNWSTAVRLASSGGSQVTWDDLVVATAWDDLGTVVTTTVDEDSGFLGGGTGVSLREAVNHSPAGSLITFAPGLSGGTITLGGTQITVAKSLIIDASGLPRGITIDANRASRLFNVNPGIPLTLKSLTLTGGNISQNGGAIVNSGSLTLFHCTLTGNSTTGYGGAISNSGSLTLTGCTLTDNQAQRGGGALSDSFGNETFVIRHCTITGNRSLGVNTGGGLDFIDSTSATLSHTILSGNMAGGVLKNYATFDATPPPLVSAGFNLSDDAPFGLTATTDLIHNPNIKLTPLGHFGGPTMTMHPLIGSSAIDAGATTHPGGTDQRGFSRFRDGNDSGGILLDIGAVEAGETYRVDTAADPGGLRNILNFAYQGNNPGIRIIFNPATFGISSPPPITLNGTELSVPADETIFIDASNLTTPVTLSGNNASRVFNITSGATVAMHSVRMVDGTAPFDEIGGGIVNEGTLSLFQSTLSGNTTNFEGGGIYNVGTLLINSSTLSGNSASSGGGILNFGLLAITSSTLSGNRANGLGGGIINDGTLTITSSTLSRNSANSGGGGIFNSTNGSLKIFSSIVAGNAAPIGPDIDGPSSIGPGNLIGLNPLLAPLGHYGGRTQTMPPLIGSPAIDAGGTTSSLTTDQRGRSRLVDGNQSGTAEVDIGAVESAFRIVTTTSDDAYGSLRQAISDASATPGWESIAFASNLSGGTILLGSTLGFSDIDGLTIDATNLPGGLTLNAGLTDRHLYSNAGSLTLRGLTFIAGRSGSNNGGSIANDAALTLDLCTFSGNGSAQNGGAISNSSPGILNLTRCTFSGNFADFGGAIFNDLGTISLTHCTLSGNTVSTHGGGISNDGPISLGHNIISGNTLTGTGQGADFFSDSVVTFTGVNLINDFAGFPIAGANVIGGDARLAPLGHYGGSTQTMALRPGSPARNAATGSTATTDQRGFPMVGVPDIGAYEAGTLSGVNLATTLAEVLPGTGPASSVTPAGDYDGDGASNEQEWVAGTILNDSASILRLGLFQEGGDLKISFPTVSGRTYRLQQSSTLLGNSWVDSGLTPKIGNGNVQNFIVTPANGPARLFFRVSVSN